MVVCIPVFGALDLFEECLASVARHTDAPIIVADDATPGDRVEELAAHHGVQLIRASENRGFVANVNNAIEEAGEADVVVVNSDVVVGPGWLDGLRTAAASDSRIATVTALADEASIVSVDAGSLSVDEAALRVREGSLRLRPQLPAAIGHCFYVTRAALDLVGDFDTAFSPGYGEEVDFSQRCLLHGLIHVLADDVWVRHRGRGSFSERAAALRAEHDALVERRYPWYRSAVRRATSGTALADALGAARRSLRPLTVTIDGTTLGPVTMGTQVATLGLIRALAELDDVRVRVALPPDPGEHARAALAEIGVETVPVDSPGEPTDVVHRNAQPVAPVNLAWLHSLGERIVVTQQDLIAYSNPGYFESFEAWDEQRTLTRQSLAIADAAVFISDYVRREAVSEELVAPQRTAVVYPGVDHRAEAPSRPASVPDGEFVVMLGADFAHKNHAFGVELFKALRERGWRGSLVSAGPRLSDSEVAADGVVRLGPVTEAEKAWLYSNAALVLYPTVSEGFGLVPFEAAASGTACAFAPVSSLAEVLDPRLATLVPWDVEASADRVLALLRDDAERARLVEAIAAHGRQYTWDLTARRCVEVYREATRGPARSARALMFGAEARSDIANALVGPGGHLPPDVQRALLAISMRPALRGPAFAALRASYRALRRARRRR